MDKSLPHEDLERSLALITERALARTERYGYLALMLLPATFAASATWLLFNLPELPSRNNAIVMCVFFALLGLAWILLAVRVLWGPLASLGNREVAAGRMSAGLSMAFTAGAMLIPWMQGRSPMNDLTALGAAMTAIALALLVRAHVRMNRLQALRARLERDLAAGN